LISLAQRVHARGGDEVLVDLGDTAVVTKVTATGAEITTVAGGAIQVTWNPGEVLYTWENGFAVVTQRDSVRFTSRDAKFQIEDLGVLGTQTGAK
jgi:flagellar basal body rod protein FlgG